MKLVVVSPLGITSHVVIDAVQASGGLATSWDVSVITPISAHPGDSVLTCVFPNNVDGTSFAVMNMYAPYEHVQNPCLL
jgi:hypothetical protein